MPKWTDSAKWWLKDSEIAQELNMSLTHVCRVRRQLQMPRKPPVTENGQRLTISEQLDRLDISGLTIEQIEGYLDLTHSYAVNLLRKRSLVAGRDFRHSRTHKPQPRTSQLKSEDVDWTLQDIELSRLYGLSKERVRQVRKELKKPLALNHKKKRGRSGKILQLDALDISDMIFDDIKEALGISKSYTSALLRRRGLVEGVDYKLRPSAETKKSLIETIDWSKSNCELASIIGVSEMTVTRYRAKYGKSVYNLTEEILGVIPVDGATVTEIKNALGKNYKPLEKLRKMEGNGLLKSQLRDDGYLVFKKVQLASSDPTNS